MLGPEANVKAKFLVDERLLELFDETGNEVIPTDSAPAVVVLSLVVGRKTLQSPELNCVDIISIIRPNKNHCLLVDVAISLSLQLRLCFEFSFLWKNGGYIYIYIPIKWSVAIQLRYVYISIYNGIAWRGRWIGCEVEPLQDCLTRPYFILFLNGNLVCCGGSSCSSGNWWCSAFTLTIFMPPKFDFTRNLLCFLQPTN